MNRNTVGKLAIIAILGFSTWGISTLPPDPPKVADQHLADAERERNLKVGVWDYVNCKQRYFSGETNLVQLNRCIRQVIKNYPVVAGFVAKDIDTEVLPEIRAEYGIE